MFNWIHKEGRFLILAVTVLGCALCASIYAWFPIAFWPVLLLVIVFWGIILQFFRNPVRSIPQLDNRLIYAPADGRICVIEETIEDEYFKGKRLQVSVFMSPFNVHVNRNPVGGVVRYFRYHPGLYLVAWHPKSSTENERTTVVYAMEKEEVLMRQVAGALARRIKWYIAEGDQVRQGGEMGFIKFGSRVDLYLPLGSEILVKMDEHVAGNRTVIARLPE